MLSATLIVAMLLTTTAFAQSQVVNAQIEIARTNRNPQVRKQAMFWLGRSSDPRAVSFFEEVLK